MLFCIIISNYQSAEKASKTISNPTIYTHPQTTLNPPSLKTTFQFGKTMLEINTSKKKTKKH